jgi:hypothetical protein
LAEQRESGGKGMGRKENLKESEFGRKRIWKKQIWKNANAKEREFKRTFQPKEFGREQRPFEGKGYSRGEDYCSVIAVVSNE